MSMGLSERFNEILFAIQIHRHNSYDEYAVYLKKRILIRNSRIATLLCLEVFYPSLSMARTEERGDCR